MTTDDAIFMNSDVQRLLRNRTVIVLGDSIQRSVYKDLVCLFSDPRSGYVFDHELRAKGELCFRNDRLIRGGVKGEKVNSTNYREEREYREGNTIFRFYFVTRCWNEYVESIVNQDMTTSVQPDVIIMNSCLWDIHHYGDEGKLNYEYFMQKLFTAVSRLPSCPLLIWNSALPLAEYCKGGFLRKGFKTLPPYEVNRGNAIAERQTMRFNFIYVDLYRSLSRHEIFQQADDGIHWSNRAHRNMTNSILTAICHRWKMNVPVPVTLLPPMYQQLEWSPPPQYLPQHILTPPVHRYHPYMWQPLQRNRAIGSIGHHRSYTDPFPLANQYLDNQEVRNSQYRARFMKWNKVKTPGSTPLATKPADRRPLKESNTATKDNSPAAKSTSGDKIDSPQQDSLENTYKDCEKCSSCKEECDDLENTNCMAHKDGEGEVLSNDDKEKQDDSINVNDDNLPHKHDDDDDDTYKDCECCGSTNEDLNTTQDISEANTLVQGNEEGNTDKSVHVANHNDSNNNDMKNCENQRKRKRDTNDVDEKDSKQPEKMSKLA